MSGKSLRHSRSRSSLVSVGCMPIIAEYDIPVPPLPTHELHRRSSSDSVTRSRPKSAPASPRNSGAYIRPKSSHGARSPPTWDNSSMPSSSYSTRPSSLNSRPSSSSSSYSLRDHGTSSVGAPYHHHGRSRSMNSKPAESKQKPRSWSYNNSPYPMPYAPPPSYSRYSREVPQSGSPLRNVVQPWNVSTGKSDDSDPEKLKKSKISSWFAGRGGWGKIGLIIALVVVLAVGLGVGLVFGLKKRGDDAKPPSASETPAVFPAGSFSFRTALTNASTACTTDPDTWRCFPDTTYAEAAASAATSAVPLAAAASFFWTIAAPDPDNGRPAYGVSSANNSFASAPKFGSVSMLLRDGNTVNERFDFEIEVNKTVVPGGLLDTNDPISRDDVTCDFRILLRGTIWTARVKGGDRQRATIGEDDNGSGSQSGATGQSRNWSTWPGEVEVVEQSRGGPTCRDSIGNNIPVAAAEGECQCRYANYNLVDSQ